MLRETVKSVVANAPILARAGSAIRARQQERQADLIRQRVAQEAAAKGIVELSEVETVVRLRERLAERAKRLGWPRKRGDLHLFVAFGLFDWEEILFEAFKPFGKVTTFEWVGRGFDLNINDWIERRAAMNEAMLVVFREANARRPVDAVIGYMSGHNTLPSTLRSMADEGAAIFNFSLDDKLDLAEPMPDGILRSPLGLAKVVDLSLTSDPASKLKYGVHGGLAAFHPEAANPDIHRPYDVAFEHDVTFVGAHYGFRPHFIDRLRALGIDIAAYGRGWPAGAIPLDKMVEMYSRSRINLGFGGIGHSRRLMCLKGRDFEVPMAGGLYLTQHNPDLELVFEIGREVVTYTDEADCAAKIRMLLADPTKADAIRKAGRERSMRDHTYDVRWTKPFQMAGLLS